MNKNILMYNLAFFILLVSIIFWKDQAILTNFHIINAI